MCGRYLIEEEAYSDILEILYRSGTMPGVGSAIPGGLLGSAQDMLPDVTPIVTNGEVFPSNYAPVLTDTGVMALKWGFPHWRNTGVIINARSETALEKKMFRKPLLEHRCVIPSNGFYEWQRSPGNSKKKLKYLFRQPDEYKLYMAGFWSTFQEGTDTVHSAFIILTTDANESVSPYHDRMPVIVSADEIDSWIDDDMFLEFALHRIGPELTAISV